MTKVHVVIDLKPAIVSSRIRGRADAFRVSGICRNNNSVRLHVNTSMTSVVRLLRQSAVILMALLCAASARAQSDTSEVFLKVGSNVYSAFSTTLTNGNWVYLDADPFADSPLRATQRSLGYREVDYKAAVYPTLSFAPVVPATAAPTVAPTTRAPTTTVA